MVYLGLVDLASEFVHQVVHHFPPIVTFRILIWGEPSVTGSGDCPPFAAAAGTAEDHHVVTD
ncbi:hypothetical protein LR032_01345, partial [Candidatus Bipolaricaulota bacterium]|nr:hypothetical protein [Candidatus Bipolaricaulota bacterium]